MKKITFLAAAILFGFQAANASEIINVSGEFRTGTSIFDAQPISFRERGIEFYVFADGQFDFNTVPSAGEDYHRGQRHGVNQTYGAPANSNAGIRIEHDSEGRVRRIGNVFINYDAYDRIKRIGSVYMSYNRYALSQVGGLKILYNRRGEITGYSGTVNGRSYNTYYNNSGYNNDYYNDDYTSPAQNDSDYYYYRKDGSKAKAEKNTSSAKEE
ncbi:hypothetical protein [Flavobacterium sp. 3HN19-14]|uniref:hypothetical protein n=1 Tax=Flavobacterium sp. 3HN19-14 TaxID=3448133 RepID=UPI003EE1D8CE